MSSPYQYLQQCGKVLLAASLSKLDVFSLDNGARLSSWTCPALFEGVDGSNSQHNEGNGPEPPTKKRRFSNPHADGETTARKFTSHKSKQLTTSVGKRQTPLIIAVASTRSGNHVILVTGEDKSIRVFEHDGKGQLRYMSQRVMPKRPCAIALTADETTLLCGDKFGDVYSIPLLFSDPSTGSEGQGEPTEIEQKAAKLSKPFMPAANGFTVHSIRNRKALENQMKQKHSTPQKSKPSFECKLLLGHVSMLTDIIFSECNGKEYVITADRDEHIRISRGIPQTHIIEGYCLGHREFVSQLCSPAGQPNLLISGGGDDDMFIWDWALGQLLQKINLRKYIEKLAPSVDQASQTDHDVNRGDNWLLESVKVAVSNIRNVANASDQEDDLILVTCEGIPAVLIFCFQENSTLSHSQTLMLDGNPLGLVVESGSKSIIVSVDSAHNPGPTNRLRNSLDPGIQPLQFFQNINSKWVKTPLQFNTESEAAPPVSDSYENDDWNLADLLYPNRKLRKTGGED